MKRKDFNAGLAANDCISWIKEWFNKNGKDCNAIIGMSGGKDSTIVAKLLVEALGKDRVIGVAMPEFGQGLNEADKICEWLGIKMYTIYISSACNGIKNSIILENPDFQLSTQSVQNIPPRIRMATLYAVSQSLNGRVVNTCNLSENWIGYSTRYGDDAGDFSPCSFFTVTEMLAIGDYLGIPYEWVHKTPDDGLPHSSPDEEKLGFTYHDLDMWIRDGIFVTGYCHDNVEEGLRQDKIDRMHRINEFKTRYMDCYIPDFS